MKTINKTIERILTVIAIISVLVISVPSLIIGFIRVYFVYTEYRYQELVYSVTSPDKTNTLNFYQLGGEYSVMFTTPFKIECVNQYGAKAINTDIKMGHMLEKNKEDFLHVEWIDRQTAGIIKTPSGRITFNCKNE